VPLLEISDLYKNFEGIKAVQHFDMNVDEGEIVGLIGPNGAGKTTVFNLVTGLQEATSGAVRYNGESLMGLRPCVIASKGIARTFQNIRLFKGMTVLDNVRSVFHCRIRYGFYDAILHTGRYADEETHIRDKALELLDVFNLASRADAVAGSLPYGDQRRLEIARALALEPKTILLDEPAAGMNPNEVGTLVQLIRSIKQRFTLTVVVIEHQMGLVMNLCERIIVMDFGEIIAAGNPFEVRTNPLVLEAYLGKGVKTA